MDAPCLQILYLCKNSSAFMTFNDLNIGNPLRNALSDLGFTHPTPIQERGFAVTMSGKDVVGIAQTGTGKTLAFLLPCLRLWAFSKNKHPQILIVVPTRELVAQIVEEVQKLTTYMNVVVTGVYGGTNMRTQQATIENGLDVIVGTPGRLLDLTLSGSLKLKHIKRFVIDEVDEMLDLGFRPQLLRLMEFLPETRQNLMFSATMTTEVENIINDFFDYPTVIEAAPTGTPLEKITQYGYQVPNFMSKASLVELLIADKSVYSKVLIFTKSKRLADKLFELIGDKFPEQVGVIHSNKAQNNRFETVRKFKTGENRIIIATDIISRGLDISEVSHVINIDTPDTAETYMHRIGRTGRAEQKGVAITFTTEAELEYLKAIEELMNTTVTHQDLPESLVLSDVLIPEEMPFVKMKTIALKIPKKNEANAAFHEKSAKGKKVNMKITRAEEMKQKYGKPKTRGQKIKRKK
jgi:ATP-dependent RNA helicase RhlE